MQIDFHYYATYCAAYLAGYSHEESIEICYSAQYVDLCSKTILGKLKAPRSAATTQLQLELMDANTDYLGLQDITRIWASFHFLPRDLYAEKPKKCSKKYLNKYRLICGPNGELVGDTVELAKGSSLQAAGIAMHVLADTWAHTYFAGTPSLVINNTNYIFNEIVPGEKGYFIRPVRFRHSVSAEDDINEGVYTSSPYQISENSIMNLGHGRAGHLPDYSFIRYSYVPAWSDHEVITKDNPSDYVHAFCQMIYALKYIRGINDSFETDTYDTAAVQPYKDEIINIITTRRLDSSDAWKAFGESLSGCMIDDFRLDRYDSEYLNASGSAKDETFLGRFFMAALAQKSMVTDRIFRSGSRLAGISIDFREKGLKGIKDYRKLAKDASGEVNDE